MVLPAPAIPSSPVVVRRRPHRLERFARWIIERPRTIVIAWAIALAIAAPFALGLSRVAQGGSEAIRGSESHAVMTRLNREFGAGAAHVVPVVVTSNVLTSDAGFARTITDLSARLMADPGIRGVSHAWNSGETRLLGRDGHSALLLVQPAAESLIEAENLTGPLRTLLAAPALPPGWRAHVTGSAAMFHDLNRRSSLDLLRAEAVGVPLTLLVLFLVFRRVVAAGLALAVALSGVGLSCALLYAANRWLPVSMLAQNVVTMIGLGAGTDYALFLLVHYRAERDRGATGAAAIVHAMRSAGPALIIAALAVAGGFAALFLVNARFVHSLALGGLTVIAGTVAASLTLLPALLQLFGNRVVARPAVDPSRVTDKGTRWSGWATSVMRRPWTCLAAALLLSTLCAWPAWRTQAWQIGADDLPKSEEAKLGSDLLATQFEPGWMAPVALLIEAREGRSLWEARNQDLVRALAGQLARQARVAHVFGFPTLLETLGKNRIAIDGGQSLPATLEDTARRVISIDGRHALIVIVPRDPPESAAALECIHQLRARSWAHFGFHVQVGGGTATVYDFDVEMFESVGRVMLALIALTFVLLLVFFHSIAVPIKAIAANLLSVFAAYGFLVLVFQDGLGARWFGMPSSAGLNSFVVLMLFTILFGLSMDYEIFLLSQIRDHFRASGDNSRSVASGLAATAGVITSAAAVMVCLFGSFGFVGLTVTRQFGLGLAFAVAFDATVVRLLIVPATMQLLGKWNWWLPRFGASHDLGTVQLTKL